MVKVAIVGAGGLSGLELIALLSAHPKAELGVVTSDKYSGQKVGDVFPRFRGLDLRFTPHDTSLEDFDAAFLAVPNKASLSLAEKGVEKGVRVIDLSGAFRLGDEETFYQYYGLRHKNKALAAEAVYGLSELYEAKIAQARLVANPGCYPTGALLGLVPLGQHATALATAPVIDAKSGVSGAGGRTEDDTTGFLHVNENFRAYKLFAHQHAPEIGQYFSELCPYPRKTHGEPLFTPHLLPLARGILSTIYLRFETAQAPEVLRAAYSEFAEAHPFVHLLPEGKNAELKQVQGTNDCVLSLHHDSTRKNWIVITVIDNLLKGAAGQAVQNFNLMFGCGETTGL